MVMIHLQTGISAASAADGGVAELHGLNFGEGVEDVAERIFSVGFNVLGAGWGVVVEDFFCPVGFDEGKVSGGASRNRLVAAAIEMLARTRVNFCRRTAIYSFSSWIASVPTEVLPPYISTS